MDAAHYFKNQVTRQKILADALEAIVGALFLDGGFKTVEAFVKQTFSPLIGAAIKEFRDGVTAAGAGAPGTARAMAAPTGATTGAKTARARIAQARKRRMVARSAAFTAGCEEARKCLFFYARWAS